MFPVLREKAKRALNFTVPLQSWTPEENLAHAWQTSSGSQPKCISDGPWLLPDALPARRKKSKSDSIRVKWFYDPTFPMLMDQRCLFMDCALNESGGLDLRSIRRKWGLSATCGVIRYREAIGVKLFILSDQDYLGPREVKVLKGDDKCISIIEDPGGVELKQRAYRQIWINRTSSLHTVRVSIYYHLAQTALPILLMLVCLAIPIVVWPRLEWNTYITLATFEILLIASTRLLVQWIRYTQDEGPPPLFLARIA